MPIEAAGAWKREKREPASWTSGGGGPPGRGDTGPSQAAIESARRANEASAARRAAEPVRETWRDDPEKVDVWDPSQDIIDRQEKARLDAEIKMNQRAADMQKAQKLAYSMQGTEGDMRQVSNLHNLTDSQLQFLIDSGFAASEASGVLGGVAGIEVEVNKAKKKFAETGDKTHLQRLGFSEEVILKMDPWKKDAAGEWIANPDYDPKLGYDPSAVYTWGDVESTALQGYGKNDPRNLYQAHTDLLSSSLSPDKYRTHMKNISAFGHPFPTPTAGGPGSGWGGGWGGPGGDVGGGGYSYGAQPGYTPEQMAGFYTPQANLQQAMVNVHATPTVFRKRGGIVSLLRLS